MAVGRPGTLTAAIVTPTSTSGETGEPFNVVSMDALWGKPHTVAGGSRKYADGSVCRRISDLSVFIGHQKGHRILAAGDLNILRGHGEHSSTYWASRYATVFSRMSALGQSFVDPQAPAGRQAEPWPDAYTVAERWSARILPTLRGRKVPPQTRRAVPGRGDDTAAVGAVLLPIP